MGKVSKHLGGMYCVVHPSGKSPSCPGACASFVWSDGCIDSNSHWPQACLSIYDEYDDNKVLTDSQVSGWPIDGDGSWVASSKACKVLPRWDSPQTSACEWSKGKDGADLEPNLPWAENSQESFWPLTFISRDFRTTHVDTITQQSCVPRAVMLLHRRAPLPARRPSMQARSKGGGAYIRYLHRAVHMPPPAIAAELLNA